MFSPHGALVDIANSKGEHDPVAWKLRLTITAEHMDSTIFLDISVSHILATCDTSTTSVIDEHGFTGYLRITIDKAANRGFA